MTWYHGTSTEAGLEDGDSMDPRKGNFEPCVWATDSLDAARKYAAQTAALLGGAPVVFEIVVDEEEIEWVERMEDIDFAPEDEDGDRIDPSDLIACRLGESGAQCLAIIGRWVAKAQAIR